MVGTGYSYTVSTVPESAQVFEAGKRCEDVRMTGHISRWRRDEHGGYGLGGSAATSDVIASGGVWWQVHMLPTAPALGRILA